MSASAAVAFPRFDFSRAPQDLAYLATRDELRGVIYGELLERRAVWLSMDDLILDSGRHNRILRDTARFRRGLAGLNGNPHTAVLDWSTADRITADALAGFPVFASTVARFGATVICCEPRDAGVANVLQQSGAVHVLGARWVGEESPVLVRGLGHVRGLGSRRDQRVGRRTWRRANAVAEYRVVCPIRVFNSASERSQTAEEIGRLCRTLGDEAIARGASEEVAAAIDRFAVELASNAIVHSEAECVALAALVISGPAARIEIAVSDNGIGMATAIRRKVPALVLERVPERHFVADLFRGVYDDDAARKGPGRGLVFGLREFLTACDGAISVRTGGVFVQANRAGCGMRVVASASDGLGTTVRLSVPLPRWMV